MGEGSQYGRPVKEELSFWTIRSKGGWAGNGTYLALLKVMYEATGLQGGGAPLLITHIKKSLLTYMLKENKPC